jgi:hypothetical protein
LASEIIACEVLPIIEALMAQKELLSEFWKLLDARPVNYLQAMHFCKINAILLLKKPKEVLINAHFE